MEMTLREAGRKGGLKRSSNMTAKQRKELASLAAKARWAKYYKNKKKK